jgi:hypothetical protein
MHAGCKCGRSWCLRKGTQKTSVRLRKTEAGTAYSVNSSGNSPSIIVPRRAFSLSTTSPSVQHGDKEEVGKKKDALWNLIGCVNIRDIKAAAMLL